MTLFFQRGPILTTDLQHRTWISIPDAATVLVPTGSTEQHGPHLPLNTDSVIAEQVAQGVASRMRQTTPNCTVLVAPVIAYGASGEHQAFPGTISIGHKALQIVLIEMVRSLSNWAERIVFVNGHGGNISTLTSAVSQMNLEKHNVAWVPCATPGGDAHAGRTETSLMLHIAPNHIELSRAEKGNNAAIEDLMATIFVNGVRGVSQTGVLGDPTGANASEGKILLEEIVSNVFNRISFGVTDNRGCLSNPHAQSARA